LSLAIIRTIQTLILPPAFIVILMFSGFLLLWFNRIAGRALITFGFLLLYGLSIYPVSNALITPLEEGLRPVALKSVKADVIVVLGGGAHDLSWLGLEPEPSDGSLQRMVAAVKLYHALHIPIMVTGGAGDPAQPLLSDAGPMARTARDLGVPMKDIILDNGSPNTLASAKAVKKQFAGKRIILATSAFHLRRALAMFRAQGLEVVPEPSGYLHGQKSLGYADALPQMSCLTVSSRAMSEYLSYSWYSILGEI